MESVKCNRCLKQTSEINPKTNKVFSKCNTCRAKRLEYNKSIRQSGRCRDCGGDAHGKARCLDCNRLMKSRVKAAGKCVSCGGGKDTPGLFCVKCSCKSISRKLFKDVNRWEEIKQLLLHQNSKCAITGVGLCIGTNASLDHIIPINRGGSNEINNLRWVHMVINRMKSDMLDHEFIEWVKLIIYNQDNLTKEDGEYRPRITSWPMCMTNLNAPTD